MARYKARSQENLMVAINLSEQLLPGTFESALDDLVEHHLDLAAFDALFHNDQRGQAAYHPKVLLKIILFGYSKGILSSRALERACRENTIFMALSGDKRPDHSTIAHFVTDHGERVKALFLEVLSICNECGLIGFEYFAVDGHKLSSNASKEYSGTVGELKRRQHKLKEKLDRCMSEHERTDKEGEEKDRAEAQREKLAKEIARYERFLATAEPKKGKTGREIQTNLTDPESAKLKTHGGFVQGYSGMAVVDSHHQVIVGATAIGTQYEGDDLIPLLEASKAAACHAGISEERFEQATVIADTNYFTEANCSHFLDSATLNGVIPDHQFRNRDQAFSERPKKRKKVHPERPEHFGGERFSYHPETDCYECPQGKLLSRYRRNRVRGSIGVVYRADECDCARCPDAAKCLLKKAKCRTVFRVTETLPAAPRPRTACERMADLIDTEEGRAAYNHRMGTVEPVFANISATKGMRCFTLRGLAKVRVQWLLFCLVHNIEKLLTTGAFEKLETAGCWK